MVELSPVYLSGCSFYDCAALLSVDLRCCADARPFYERVAQDFITSINIVKAIFTGLQYMFLAECVAAGHASSQL